MAAPSPDPGLATLTHHHDRRARLPKDHGPGSILGPPRITDGPGPLKITLFGRGSRIITEPRPNRPAPPSTTGGGKAAYPDAAYWMSNHPSVHPSRRGSLSIMDVWTSIAPAEGGMDVYPSLCVSSRILPRHVSSRRRILPRHVSSRRILPRHVSSRRILPRHVSSRLILPRHVSSRLILPRHVSSRRILPRHVSSRRILPRHVSCVTSRIRAPTSRCVSPARVATASGPLGAARGRGSRGLRAVLARLWLACGSRGARRAAAADARVMCARI